MHDCVSARCVPDFARPLPGDKGPQSAASTSNVIEISNATALWEVSPGWNFRARADT